MANFLSVENISKSLGDRLLLSNISFGVNEGDKIGIVARNGTGKTTLLRMLAGDDTPDSGKIIFRSGIRVGYLPQDPIFTSGVSVFDAALEGDDNISTLVRSYRQAASTGNAEEFVHQMDTANAWDYEDRLHQMLTRLGLIDHQQNVDTLSGGQRKRLALARVLIQEPDFIILDEPTNHLDISTIEWLEAYLKRARTTLLMVTHDRYFLDRVCSKIIELDRTEAYIYEGNYDNYLRRRAERIEAMTAELAKIRNTLRREQEWMSRQPQARAGKAKFRIDAFYQLKERSQVNLTENNISLQTKSSRIGSKIFEAEHISKRFGEKIILDDFSYTFAPHEKVGIIGENGVGKSTFVKMLQGIISADAGQWNVGDTIRFGYYSQEGIQFDQHKKVIDAVNEIAEDIELSAGLHIAPMQYLQKFLFSPPDQQKYIHTLSGGERCRLHLAVVLMMQPNFLILDEPTNDLDIVTLGILEEYLADFKGCVIVISHDRYFLDNIVDHLFVMEGNGVLKDFPGNYSDYRQWLDERTAEASKEKASTTSDTRPQRTPRPEKMTFKERREFEALSEELEQLNAEKSDLEVFFGSGESVTPEVFKARSIRYEELKEIIDEKEFRWLELSEKE